MGYRMRSGWNSTCLKAKQRGHSAPRLYGSSGSPSHLMNLPVSLSEYTSTPQPSWQPGADHTEVRVTIMPSSSYCHSPGCFQRGSTSCFLPAPKLNWFSSLDVPISSRSFSATAFSTIATPLDSRSCRVSAPIGPPPLGLVRVKHAHGMSVSRNEYADCESVHWYEVVIWGFARLGRPGRIGGRHGLAARSVLARANSPQGCSAHGVRRRRATRGKSPKGESTAGPRSPSDSS